MNDTGRQTVRRILLLGALAVLTGMLMAAHADDFDGSAPSASPDSRHPAVIYLRQRVTDLTNTLSTAEIMRIAHPLAQLERMTGHQVAVLLLPSVRPQRIDRFANALLAANGIGRLHDDDGMLIVVATQDRQVYIAVGPGLKPYLSERQAATVVRQVMAPHFRHQDYAGGLEAAAMSLVPRLEKNVPESTRLARGMAGEPLVPPVPPAVPSLSVPPSSAPLRPAPEISPSTAQGIPLPPVPATLLDQPAVSTSAHDAALLDQPVRTVPPPAAVSPQPSPPHRTRRAPLKEIIGVAVFLVLMVVLRSAMRRRRPAKAGKHEDAEDEIKL